MMGKVALGAAGVALAAGAAIATNVALKDKKTRARFQKGADRIQKVLEEGTERYQAYQHRIGLNKGKGKVSKN